MIEKQCCLPCGLHMILMNVTQIALSITQTFNSTLTSIEIFSPKCNQIVTICQINPQCSSQVREQTLENFYDNIWTKNIRKQSSLYIEVHFKLN